MQSQLAMAKAMKGVTKVYNKGCGITGCGITGCGITRCGIGCGSLFSQAMTRMNSQMKLPQLQKIMMEFEREVCGRGINLLPHYHHIVVKIVLQVHVQYVCIHVPYFLT